MDLRCEKCDKIYDKKKYTPRYLNCGHALCSKCLEDILYTHCPECQQPLGKKSLSQFPVAHGILEMSININTLYERQYIEDTFSNLKATMTSQMFSVHREICSLKEEIERQTKDVETKIKKKDMLKKAIGKVDTLEQGDFKFEEILKILSSYERNLFNLNKNDSHCVSLQKEEFSNSRNFMLEECLWFMSRLANPSNARFAVLDKKKLVSLDIIRVYPVILVFKKVSEGEEWYAVHPLKNEMMYGKLSVEDDFLRLHCLELEREKKCFKSVWFQELTNMVDWNYAFLKILCCAQGLQRTVQIEKGKSRKADQFFQLCSGEYGSTYKGSNFVLGTSDEDFESILLVEEVKQSDLFCKEQSKFKQLKDFDTVCVVGEMYVSVWLKDGGFEIVKSKISDGSIVNTAGTILSPKDLKESIFYDEGNIIADCGIAIKLSLT